MFGIRVLIELCRLLHAHIAYEIDTTKIIAIILPNFLLFAYLDTVEFNRLPCSNYKMYADAVFADQFRYQLTMFGNPTSKGLSRLLHAHIAYEIDTAKIIAAFSRISYCLHDFIRLNSIVCFDQTTRYTMMRFSLIDSAIN